MELIKDIYFNTDKLVENTKVKISYTGKFYQTENNKVYIHYGYGKDWNNLNEVEMKKTDLGYQAELTLLGTDTINFCFKNQNNEWDNNYGNNYIFNIEKTVKNTFGTINGSKGTFFNTVSPIIGNTVEKVEKNNSSTKGNIYWNFTEQQGTNKIPTQMNASGIIEDTTNGSPESIDAIIGATTGITTIVGNTTNIANTQTQSKNIGYTGIANNIRTTGVNGINSMSNTTVATGVNGTNSVSNTTEISGINNTTGNSNTTGFTRINGTNGNSTSGLTGANGVSNTTGISGINNTNGFSNKVGNTVVTSDTIPVSTIFTPIAGTSTPTTKFNNNVTGNTTQKNPVYSNQQTGNEKPFGSIFGNFKGNNNPINTFVNNIKKVTFNSKISTPNAINTQNTTIQNNIQNNVQNSNTINTTALTVTSNNIHWAQKIKTTVCKFFSYVPKIISGNYKRNVGKNTNTNIK